MKVSILAIPCMAAALLAGAPSLHADTVTGQIFYTSLSNLNNASVPSPTSSFYTLPPAGTLVDSFQITNASGSVFNMNSGNTADGYTIKGFLSSGGDIINSFTGPAPGTDLMNGPAGCHNADCTTVAIYQFYGSINLSSPFTFTVEHDDGFIVSNGSTLFADPGCFDPGATAAIGTTCTIPAGFYNDLTVSYAEVDGPPGVLTGATLVGLQAPVPTPEPSSIALLGTGLLAAAGAVRRRLGSK